MADEDEANRENSTEAPTLEQSHDSIPPHQQDLPSDHSPSVQAGPSKTGRPLPPLPIPRLPVVRLPLCTHSVVERLHCMDPLERCESCGRIPFLGWFFVCVEDSSGFSDPLDPIGGPFLSPWVLKAIETGQYTVEEREVLIQQKLHVLKVADLEGAPSSPSLSMLDEYEAGEHANHQTGQVSPSASSEDSSATLSPRPLPPLPCTLRACRHCERRCANLEERSWLSINEVCDDSVRPPAPVELAGRPISDVNLVRNLGWRTAKSSSKTVDYTNSGPEGPYDESDAIDLTQEELSKLVGHMLNIAATSDIKEQYSDSGSNESGLSILVGLEADDELDIGGQDRCDRVSLQ